MHEAPGLLAAAYALDGYVVVPGLLAFAEVEALRSEALRLVREDAAALSGDHIEDVADPQARYLCIHFPHKLSPALRGTLAHPAIVGVLTRLIGPDVKAMQSMLFLKHAGKPGKAWHQDEHFIPTRDRSLTAAWSRSTMRPRGQRPLGDTREPTGWRAVADAPARLGRV